MRRGSIVVESAELKQMNDELRKEMEEIRCSSRGELLRAWEEMEQLEDQKDELIAENFGLKYELEATQKREEELLKRLKAIEEGANRNNKTITTGGKGKRDGRRSFTFGISNNDSSKSLLSDKDMIEQQIASKIESYEQEKEELTNEWQYKLQCRELVLNSLETTTVIQGESIEKLQHRLDQHEKDRQEQEEKMMKKVNDLSKKVDEKRKVIAKQEKKMRRFRAYIEDLTNELQRVADDREKISTEKVISSSSISICSKETATSKETISDDEASPLMVNKRRNSLVPATA